MCTLYWSYVWDNFLTFVCSIMTEFQKPLNETKHVSQDRMHLTISVWDAPVGKEVRARWPRRLCQDVQIRSCPLFWHDQQTQQCSLLLLCSGQNWNQRPVLWMGHGQLPEAWGNMGKKLQWYCLKSQILASWAASYGGILSTTAGRTFSTFVPSLADIWK